MSMMIQPARFAAAGGAPGVAYRYVGIQSLSSGNGFISAVQVSMFETGSATDCCLAGTMATSFSVNGTNVASNMNDNNTGTFMSSANSSAAFQGVVSCDFGAGVTKQITKIGWRSRSTTSSENPTVWRVVGKQNSGDDWSHIAFLTDKSWTSSEYYEETFTPIGDISLLPGYQYFKFTVTASQTVGAYCSVNEIILREVASGPGRQPWYKSVTQSSYLAGGYEGAHAFDASNANNGWYSGATTYPQTVTLDLGAGYKLNVVEIGIYPRTGETNLAPKDFKIEGSNDNSTWTPLLISTGQTGWTSAAERTFSIADSISYPSPKLGAVSSTVTPTFTALEGAPTFALTAGTLPTGMSLNSSTGVISGTPSSFGTYSGLQVTMTSGAVATTSASFTITTVNVGTITLNPSDKSSKLTLSNGNLTTTLTSGAGAYGSVRATRGIDPSTDTGYFEVLCQVSTASNYQILGVGSATHTLADAVGRAADGWGYYQQTGQKMNNNVLATFGASWTNGDVIMVAVKNGKVYFGKNGVWQGSGDPVAETGQAYSITGTVYPMLSQWASTHQMTARFKATDFSYAPPAGYDPWGY